jgi:transposase
MTPTTRDTNGSKVLFVALELASKAWKLAFARDLASPRIRTIHAGDMAAFAAEVKAAKMKLGLPPEASVYSCYEAGRDGFWLHRWLITHGCENIVVDPASIEVERRQRRRKTDRLDAMKLVSRLARHYWGEKVWSVVRIPTPEMEDRRRLIRERERLVRERTQHQARLRGLLAAQGIQVKKLAEAQEAIRLCDGQPLPPRLAEEVRRELERLKLVNRQMAEVEKMVAQEVASNDVVGERTQRVARLKSIGPVASSVLGLEFFWRDFRNRREVAAAVGLTGTPHQSGEMAHEQGVSKAGNRRVRAVIIEIAWVWLRYQPDSALSRWFQTRFGTASGRMRRIGVVALARRLVIALWRFAAQGIVPDGAILKPAEDMN